MNAGVELAPLRRRSPDAPWDRVEALLARLADEGLAAREGSLVRLESKGRLLADAIASEIMVAFDRPAAVAAAG
jgi:coproporphyrinogen III oxidase-like Fe-S oxidoreductase